METDIDLYKAAADGRLEDLRKAIAAGIPVNSIDDSGKTALIYACDYQGSDECTEFLLSKGADSDYGDSTTGSALNYACMYGHLKRVKLLLDAGANVNLAGGYGRTPLMYATGGEAEDCTEIMKLLLKKGADVSARNDGDDDAFTEALSATLWKIPVERYKLLIENGYNVNGVKTKYYHGQTPLMWACFCGKLDAVKILVEAGADVNQKEKNGETAIISAMQSGPDDHPEIVEYLLDHGAVPDSSSQFGHTVLLYAVEGGHLSIIKKLIEKGANIEQTDKYSRQTPLISAAYKEKTDVVKLLLESGANIHAVDSRGNTAFLHAAWKGNLGIMKLLLEKGADPEHRNSLNWNALMQAIVEGHEEAFDFLLALGSAFEYHEKEKGATPLMIAAWKGSLPIVKKLLEKGANPLEKDSAGKTVIDYAQETYNPALTDYLREKLSGGGQRIGDS
jgi:ankyrin repeat protein